MLISLPGDSRAPSIIPEVSSPSPSSCPGSFLAPPCDPSQPPPPFRSRLVSWPLARCCGSSVSPDCLRFVDFPVFRSCGPHSITFSTGFAQGPGGFLQAALGPAPASSLPQTPRWASSCSAHPSLCPLCGLRTPYGYGFQPTPDSLPLDRG